MADEKTIKVESEEGSAVMIPPALNPQANGKLVWMSSKPSTPAAKARAMAALTGAVAKLSDRINQTIKVKDVIFQGVQLIDEDTGEVNAAVRIIVEQANGQLLGCTSAGIHQAFGLLFQMEGPPPWKPPLSLKVKQIETGSGRRFFTLEYADTKDKDTDYKS